MLGPSALLVSLASFQHAQILNERSVADRCRLLGVCHVVDYDGEPEQGFWPCDPDKEVHELRGDRFRRPGDRCPGNRAERLFEVVQFAVGGRQYERRVVRLTLDPRVPYTISVNTRPVYIEGENGRRLVIVVSVLSTDLEEVTRRWCAYAPTLAPLRPTQKLTTIL